MIGSKKHNIFSRPLLKIDDNSSVSVKVIATHLLKYFYSLKNFPEKYNHLFFSDIDKPPTHFAYLCPLCLVNGVLLESSISIGWHSEFSLDHFPPKSVGGFLETLVCKKCNNDAGGKYESELKEKMKQMSFNNRIFSSSLVGKAKINGVPGSYTSQLSIGADGKHEISLKPNPKAHTPLLDKFIEDSKRNFTSSIEVTMPIANEIKVSKSFLKAAYLFCFDYWGYEFVFSKTGEMIRKVLRDEIQYPAFTPTFWLREAIEISDTRFTPLGLCYLQKPKDCKCFVVNMLLEDNETNYKNLASVLIPNPTDTGWDDLKRIQDIFNDKFDKIEVSFAHVIDFSIVENVVDGYAQSWKKLIDSD